MPDEKKNVMTPFRFVGGVVIFGTMLVIVLMTLFLFSPGMFHSQSAEGWFVRILLASLVVSGVGGLWMFGETQNPWWVLPLLVVGGAVAMWLLFANAIGISAMH